MAQAVLAAGGAVMIGDQYLTTGRALLDAQQAGEPAGEPAAFGRLDVSVVSSVKCRVTAAVRRPGRLHALVSNACIADRQQHLIPFPF